MLAHRYPQSESSNERDSANVPMKCRGAQGLEHSSGEQNQTAHPELHREKLGMLDTPGKRTVNLLAI